MSDVGSRLQGPVAVVTFDHPPVNGLSHAVRVGLARALERAIADEGVSAVVLTGGGRHFSAGADIREFGTPAATAEWRVGLGSGHQPTLALDDGDIPDLAVLKRELHGLPLL